MITREEKEKVRRETLGKHFYNLSLATFTAMVLGNFTPLFQTAATNWSTIVYSLVIGIGASCVFAYVGNKILKT